MITEPQRLPEDLLAFWRGVPSSIVTDSLTRLGLGAWMDDIRPLSPSWRVSGRVRTLQYGARSGRKLSPHNIYTWCEQLAPGDVMVIGTSATKGWLLGENTAHFCVNHGLGGIVTDGRVRDLTELLEMPLPIFARGTAARPFSAEVEVVAVDVPIEVAGAHVRPGDLLVGDADGVVIAPGEVAAELVGEAEELILLEREQEVAIRERRPLGEIQEISRRKKVRRGRSVG